MRATRSSSRCVSYDGSPSMRCLREADGHKFCLTHLARLTRAPNYKKFDRDLPDLADPEGPSTLQAKSTTNLLKIHSRVQAAIEARQAFAEMMIADECRDYGHLRRVYGLMRLAEEIEGVLVMRLAAGSVEGEVEPREVDSTPRVEDSPRRGVEVAVARGRSSRKKAEDWRTEVERALREIRVSALEVEGHCLETFSRLGYPNRPEFISTLSSIWEITPRDVGFWGTKGINREGERRGEPPDLDFRSRHDEATRAWQELESATDKTDLVELLADVCGSDYLVSYFADQRFLYPLGRRNVYLMSMSGPLRVTRYSEDRGYPPLIMAATYDPSGERRGALNMARAAQVCKKACVLAKMGVVKDYAYDKLRHDVDVYQIFYKFDLVPVD